MDTSIVSKKYRILNKYLLNNSDLNLENFKNKFVTRVKLKKLIENIHEKRGYSGIFFEYNLKDYLELNKILNRKFQTLSYFGYKKDFFIKLFKNNKFNGIDRVVPVGEALNMDLVWDGINVISKLSRIIDIK